jgi:hypothetical protein
MSAPGFGVSSPDDPGLIAVIAAITESPELARHLAEINETAPELTQV